MKPDPLGRWGAFLAGRDPSPYLVVEFLETKPNSGWGEALNWLLIEHEYKIARLEEALENQGLLRIED